MLATYSPFQIVLFGIIIANVVLSLMAFNNFHLFEKWKFHIGAIWERKEYHRLLSAAFVHGSFMHLFLNMYVLLMFGESLMRYVTVWQFLGIYFISLILGNLLPLYLHKNELNYSAVGASGAVSGILYASIYFMPFGGIGIILIPVYIPSWLFGVLYLAYSIWGIKKNNDNIGHDAHFAGAVAGLLIAIILKPSYLIQNWWVVLAMLVPVIYFFTQMTSLFSLKQSKKQNESFNYSKRKIEDLYHYSKAKKKEELDTLLDKVGEKGVKNLSAYEKKRLKDLSQELSDE